MAKVKKSKTAKSSVISEKAEKIDKSGLLVKDKRERLLSDKARAGASTQRMKQMDEKNKAQRPPKLKPDDTKRREKLVKKSTASSKGMK